MPQTPLASVVIPAYRAAQVLPRCLDSVLAQTCAEHVQIIVVDDGSPEDLGPTLAPYESRIELIRQPNKGVSAARNLGLDHAKGKAVVFLDQDDWLEKSYIEEMSAALEQRAELGSVYCDKKRYLDTGSELQLIGEFVAGDRTDDMLRAIIVKSFLNTPGSYMSRTEVARKVGGFDVGLSSVGEDWDYSIKLALEAPWGYVPKTLFCLREHEQNTTKKVFVGMYEGSKTILSRYADPKEHREEIAASMRHLKLFFAGLMRSYLTTKAREKSLRLSDFSQVTRGLVRNPELIKPFLFRKA